MCVICIADVRILYTCRVLYMCCVRCTSFALLVSLEMEVFRCFPLFGCATSPPKIPQKLDHEVRNKLTHYKPNFFAAHNKFYTCCRVVKCVGFKFRSFGFVGSTPTACTFFFFFMVLVLFYFTLTT